MESPRQVEASLMERPEVHDDSLSTRSNARLISNPLSSPANRPVAEHHGPRRFSNWEARRIHTWKTPLLMVLFFLAGLAMSMAHCIFYPKLKDQVVGKADQQEEKIR